MNKSNKDCVAIVEILPGLTRKEQQPENPVLARIRKLKRLLDELEAEVTRED